MQFVPLFYKYSQIKIVRCEISNFLLTKTEAIIQFEEII